MSESSTIRLKLPLPTTRFTWYPSRTDSFLPLKSNDWNMNIVFGMDYVQVFFVNFLEGTSKNVLWKRNRGNQTCWSPKKWTRWWQLKDFLSSPRNLGKIPILTNIFQWVEAPKSEGYQALIFPFFHVWGWWRLGDYYFPVGLVQPPTQLIQRHLLNEHGFSWTSMYGIFAYTYHKNQLFM